MQDVRSEQGTIRTETWGPELHLRPKFKVRGRPKGIRQTVSGLPFKKTTSSKVSHKPSLKRRSEKRHGKQSNQKKARIGSDPGTVGAILYIYIYFF